MSIQIINQTQSKAKSPSNSINRLETVHSNHQPSSITSQIELKLIKQSSCNKQNNETDVQCATVKEQLDASKDKMADPIHHEEFSQDPTTQQTQILFPSFPTFQQKKKKKKKKAPIQNDSNVENERLLDTSGWLSN